MAIARPRTRYAESDGARIAYQSFGDGPRDIVVVSGFASHVDLAWDRPEFRAWFEGLAGFGRVVTFDKRGVGLSDRVETAPSLDQRVDDLLAVLDAAGVARAHLLGVSEGAPMSILFSATHPARVASLSLWGGMARTSAAPGYPFAATSEDLLASATELITPHWDEPVMIEVMQPSVAHEPERQDAFARYAQAAASPGMVLQLFLMALDYDVREVLPSVHVPTLVMHARGDRTVPVESGRWLADQIPGSTYVEFDGIDHTPIEDAVPEVVAEIEEFLTGSRTLPEPDRVLATVMFTDIVASTERASAMGDEAWRALLDSTTRPSTAWWPPTEVSCARPWVTVCSRRSTVRPRRSRPPSRSAAAWTIWSSRSASGCTAARSNSRATTSPASPSTSPPACPGPPTPARSW